MLRILYQLYRIVLFFTRPLTLGVRVILLRGSTVLLVRQTYMRGWFLPGGGIKRLETLEQAARREAREEVGAQIGPLELFGAYSSFSEWKSDHNSVFLAREFQLDGSHDREVAEIRFFPLNALPVDLWPGHRRRLEEINLSAISARRGKAIDPKSPDITRFGEW